MTGLVRRSLSTLTYHALQCRNGRTPGLRMLMYHRVTDAHPNDRLCVPVARFARQMQFLHDAGYASVTFAQAVAWVSQGGILPPKAIAITFDDGFEDNFLYAYPALARHGFTGCFFIPSGFIAVGRSEAIRPEDWPMTWAQLKELLQRGHEIGAHSVSHRKLARLSPDQMQQEVQQSKAMLEQQLERPVDWFCYPAGDYNASVKAAVQTGGYRGACTVEPGANLPGGDPFALKRTEVSAFDSLWDFEKKLAGAYDWMHVTAQALQQMRPRRECANATLPDREIAKSRESAKRDEHGS